MQSPAISLRPMTPRDTSNPYGPFAMINAYLSTSSDPSSAATSLLHPLMVDSNIELPPSNRLNPANYIVNLFCSVLFAAKQIPHDHPWQERIAALLHAIKIHPAPSNLVSEYIYESQSMYEFKWSEFPTLNDQFSECMSFKNRFYPLPPEFDTKWDDRWTPQEWLNLNAFMALLVSKDIFEGRLGCYMVENGVCVLRTILELDNRNTEILEDNIPSAALWVLSAGRWMYEHRGLNILTRFSFGQIDVESIELYDGPDQLCDERWKLWKEMFGKLGEREDLSIEAVDWAQKASAFMETID